MARKREEPPKTPAALTQSVEQAQAALTDRIRLGGELLNREVTHGGQMESAKAEFKKWTDYNVALLERMFTTEEIAREYEWSGSSGTVTMVYAARHHAVDDFNEARDGVRGQLQYLDSLLDRIQLFASPAFGAPRARPTRAGASTNSLSRVFIVHGQEDAPREAVARFLEKAGIHAIILHEQANRGDTIIEKLERNSDVHFAVVLLTADDEGRRMGDTAPGKPRARQNVILELGYFVALLGRKSVCALYQEGVELPSDWNGVVWVALDAHEGWKYKLARELNAAGFSIDLNHI